MEGPFLDHPGFVVIVVFVDTLPYFGIVPISEEYFVDDVADDEAGGGVEVAVEEQYFIVCLLLNLLRQLT